MILFPAPDMSLADITGAYLTLPFIPSGCGDVATVNPTEVTDLDYGAFKRVYVSFAYKPTAPSNHSPPRIFWEIERGLTDPGPYSWTLQRSQGGTPRADDWITCNTSTGDIFYLDDLSTDNPSKKQHMFGKTITVFYRVQLTTPKGCYQSMQATVSGLLNKHDWGIVRELYRKQQLAHSIFSSERGWLLKGRRYGPRCTCSRDSLVQFLPTDGSTDYNKSSFITDEIIDSHCTTCFGTGIINGYFAPTEFYCLLTQEKTREQRDLKSGTVKEVVVQGQFTGLIPLIQNDVFVSADSDRRYYIHSVVVGSQWKGIIINQIAEMRLAPFSSVIYDFPVSKGTI